MKILVADDLKANRYLLESALKSAGYLVKSANNGLDALNILRNSPVDMIITDILMPKMDGFQLCREVKADENLKNIPFVFYTASYTTPEDQKFGLDLGADRYIIKPVDPDEFLSVIGGILSEANSIVPSEPETGVGHEDSFLQDYNRRIFAQLEKKIGELEEKNCELVESRRKLAESERRYRELFENISESVFLHEYLFESLQGVIVEANETACRNLGYSHDELLDKMFGEIALTPAGKEAGAGYDRIALMGKVSFEAEFRRSDGSSFPVHVKAKLIEFGGDKYILSLVRDLTAEKAGLKRESEALERIEENLIQLSILNDEIRNPLAVISGIVSIDEGESSEEILNQVEIINSIVSRLDRGWLESTKIRNYLIKHHGFSEDGENL